jgi:nicotinamide mononucleotide transporter
MSLSALLSDPLLSLWNQPVTGLEVIAFVTGLASVWLTYRMHIANWPLGMLSVGCYAWLFFHARLYADASLQIAFLALCAYGWWSWLRERGARAHIAVSRAPLRECVVAAGVTLAAIAAVALFLHHYTDSPAPLLDACVFALSLAATYGQARARLESWWLWIAVDLISIPLYWSRSLPLTAFLYILFLLICLRGLAGWKAQLRAGVAA